MKFEYYKNNGLGKSVLHYLKVIIQNIVIHIVNYFELAIPLKENLVLECESDMDDNPRAIYEYLLKVHWNDKHKIIWIVKDVGYCRNNYNEKNVFFVSRYDKKLRKQLKLNFYLNTSKWFVFSHPYWFKKKRENQLVVNIWHGIPLKKGSKVEYSWKVTDFTIVPSKPVSPLYEEFCSCPKEKIVVCSAPRNDLLWRKNKKEILQNLGYSFYEDKIVMCMPTYRQTANTSDSSVYDKYLLSVVNSEGEKRDLNNYLVSHGIHLIIKMHPLQDSSVLEMKDCSNIHYLCNKDLLDKKILLYELLGCCDALLSDVSSVTFDFLALNRPIGYFVKDIEFYSRGFLVDNIFEYMPGRKIQSLENLYSFFEDLFLSNDCFSDERRKLVKRLQIDCSDTNCKRFVEWMFKK